LAGSVAAANILTDAMAFGDPCESGSRVVPLEYGVPCQSGIDTEFVKITIFLSAAWIR
jgi:hypothetical protein